jgi:iron complex outermembrane receptor protein
MKPFLFTTLAVSTPLLLADDSVTVLDDLVVSAVRTDQTTFELVQPASVLTGKDLQLKLAPTLGETLAGEPGVSSTAFGPGASRPVIRGLGNDRVRILQNGTSVLDVSNVSPDHAVASDPLTIRSVEVVRGPATLLYGPNTLGGVVNVTDDRIPQERFDGKWPHGKLETSAGSADELFSQSGAITWGHGPIVFHLNGFNRETDDLHIPGFARSERLRELSPLPPGEEEPRGVLPNSFTHSKGGAIGGSYVWDKGYVGLSYSGIDSDYGTVAEPDVTIGLRQRRWDLRGAFREPAEHIKELSYKFGWSDYEHTEFEGAEVGTQFHIEGFDARADLTHEKIGPFEGAVGVESQFNTFSALGEEAFLPEVDTSVNSAFFFEEIPVGPVRFQFGARYDHQTNESSSDPNFGPGRDLDFDAFSLSTGLVYTPVKNYAVALSFAYTQRPPTYVELFANGPHVATGTFEVGDPSLDNEEAFSIDLSVRKNAGFVTGSAGVFYYRFNDYISLQPTGATDPDEDLPIFAYQAIDADYYGAEIETTLHLLAPAEADDATPAADTQAGTPAGVKAADSRLDLTLRADLVRAENRRTGEDLPQIPPFRTSAALDYQQGPFGARLEGQYAAHQSHTADFELPTDSYFLLNAGVSYDVKLGDTMTTFYVKAINLTDEEARQHTSLLKDVAPMAGRGVLAGIRAEF